MAGREEPRKKDSRNLFHENKHSDSCSNGPREFDTGTRMLIKMHLPNISIQVKSCWTTMQNIVRLSSLITLGASISDVCIGRGALKVLNTGTLSQIRTKLRDWAVWQARAGCYSQAALSLNDSKTL